jgi:hypothetical protein
MPFITNHWLLHWVTSYSAPAPEDRRLEAPADLPASPDKITEITSDSLGAFIRDEAAACWLAKTRAPRPLADYVAAIRRGRD